MHLVPNREQCSINQNSDVLSAPSDVLSAPSGFSMQPAEAFHDEPLRANTTTLKRKKYCRQCWRKDFHFRV